MTDQPAINLFERARSGDRDAFAELQQELDPAARRFVRRLVGREPADDIIQQAFFALFKNLERLDGEGHLRPFLFRVLRNLCYDELRAQGRYEEVSLYDEYDEDAPGVVVADQQPEPEETVHWLLIYSEVQRLIARLPETQRQALLLYTEGGLSYAEIAEATGVNIGTVKSRLFHAKQNLIRRVSADTAYALQLERGNDDDDE